MGVSTLSEITAEMTGGDWERKHKQSVKEHNARKRDGLETDPQDTTIDPDYPDRKDPD